MRKTYRGLASGLVCAAAVTMASAGTATADEPAQPIPVSEFQGVNWADPRDNYADDAVVPSGLSADDDYETVYAKASAIIGEFEADLGANTVRLPINPSSVNGPFWGAYTGAIDAAVDAGFKVILGYWEADSAKDGLIDDEAAFDQMWRTVTEQYQDNGQVYFEPMNEPFGYSTEDWNNVAADWVETYSSVPRDRIFIGGSGYSEDVTTVCSDSRLDGTRLALHQYGFWHEDWTSYDQWAEDLRARVGDCASRTVLDEFGATMTSGLDYNGDINGSNEVAYIQAATDTVRELGMGAVYWPGLRNGDTYSLTTLEGEGTELSLTVTNASGAERLAWAWGR